MGRTIYFSKIVMDNSLYEKFKNNRVYIDFWEDEVFTEEEIMDKFINSLRIGETPNDSTFEDFCSEWGYQNVENFIEDSDGDNDYVTHQLNEDEILVVFVRYC